MKRIISLITGVIAAIQLLIVPSYTADRFEAAETAVYHMTAGWNLGNSLDCCGDWIEKYTPNKAPDYETAWGNPVTAKRLITAVKKAGFNTVRVPVTWDQHMDSRNNVKKEWMDRVQEVVDYVISQDMYCILNVHHDGGSEGWIHASAKSYKENSGRFASLWKQIAVRFGEYGEKLIFEGFNEIIDMNGSWGTTDKEGYAAVNDFNQLFVTAVRTAGGKNTERNLMIQTYAGNSLEQNLNNFTIPNDSAENHIIMQTHYYDPQSFTSKSATWTEMTDKWGTDSEKSEISAMIDRLKKYSDILDVPVVIGEFGCEYKNNNSERVKYASHLVSTAAKNDIKCIWWDTGDFGLFDRNNYKPAHQEVITALVTSAENISQQRKIRADYKKPHCTT